MNGTPDPNRPYPPTNAASVRRREAAGRPMLPDFLRRAGEALGRPIAAYDLVDLPMTDNLADEFAAKLSGCADRSVQSCRRTLAAADLPQLAQRLTGGADSDPDRPVMLFRRGSEYCGAIVTTLESVLIRAAALLAAEGDLWVGTKDMSDGLRLTPSAGSPMAFDLTVWGGNWLPPLGS